MKFVVWNWKRFDRLKDRFDDPNFCYSETFKIFMNKIPDVSRLRLFRLERHEIKDYMQIIYWLEKLWLSRLELLILIYFIEYMLETYKSTTRRSEIHPESKNNANASYHVIQIFDILWKLWLNMNIQPNLNEFCTKYKNILNKNLFYICIIVVFHDFVEDLLWTIPRFDSTFEFESQKDFFVKVDGNLRLNEHWKLELENYLKTLSMVTLPVKFTKYMPLLSQYLYWKISFESALDQDETQFLYDINIFHIFSLMYEMRYMFWNISYNSSYSNRSTYFLSDDEICLVLEKLNLLTFKPWGTDRYDPAQIANYMEWILNDEFCWIIKSWDLLHNSYKWIKDSQVQKYVRNYWSIIDIIREIYPFLSENIKSYLDLSMKKVITSTNLDLFESLS